jgi:hypothetical protein
LLTDPPYMTDVEDIEGFVHAWLPAALAALKPTGRAYICIAAYPLELAAFTAFAATHEGALVFDQVLVWTYRNTLARVPAAAPTSGSPGQGYARGFGRLVRWR